MYEFARIELSPMESHINFTYKSQRLDMDSVASPDKEVISLHSKDTEDTDVMEVISTDDDNDNDDDDNIDSRDFYVTSSATPKLLNLNWKHYKLTHLVFRIRTCLQSRPCTICLYLCLTLQLLLGIICLVVISILVVTPFREISTYEHGNCTPTDVSIDPADRRCSCGKGCTSLYPCIRITVSINNVNYTRLSGQSSLLYENEVIIRRKVGRILISLSGDLSVIDVMLIKAPCLQVQEWDEIQRDHQI